MIANCAPLYYSLFTLYYLLFTIYFSLFTITYYLWQPCCHLCHTDRVGFRQRAERIHFQLSAIRFGFFRLRVQNDISRVIALPPVILSGLVPEESRTSSLVLWIIFIDILRSAITIASVDMIRLEYYFVSFRPRA